MPVRHYKNSSHAETNVEEFVMETHRIHPELLQRQVRVLVVGCGGTGSAVVAGLPYLHQSLVARGHPGGLHVTVLDGDTISLTNCVRQPFTRSEVGLNKAVVLVNRLNLFWRLKWEAVPAHLKSGSHISRGYSGDDLRAHIVIGCVDTRAARAAIRDAVGNWSTVSYWLDLGNNADSGQFILGEPLNERNRRSRLRLRTVGELFSEILDPTLDNDGEPSCSAAAALERQEPFINSTLAQHALALLARLFRYGEISYHGGFINLATGASSVLRIDPQCWKRNRRLNKHYTPSRRGQQDAFDVGSSQERVDGSDLRVLSARLRSSEPGRAIRRQLPCATQ
jgi:PRTRC genetic system ThiF family protein